MNSSYGNKLIFLISQPRAGSTMLQRIIGSHTSIYTVSEPWIMLPPIYAIRKNGYKAEFNAFWAHSAMSNFSKSLPDGIDDYYEGIRRMYSHLYERCLETSQKSYFLDKTPRYYNIIPELYKVFPQAKFIILLRNPIACLRSILNTWVKENYFYLYYYKHDLLRAPYLLLEGIKYLNNCAIVVKYEDIIENPEIQIKKVCEYVGVEYQPSMIEYGKINKLNWHYGDKTTVNKNTRPIKTSKNQWKAFINDSQMWRLCDNYLKILDKSLMTELGYSYHEIYDQLINNSPSHRMKFLTYRLSYLVRKDYSKRNMFEKCILKSVIRFRKMMIRQ